MDGTSSPNGKIDEGGSKCSKENAISITIHEEGCESQKLSDSDILVVNNPNQRGLSQKVGTLHYECAADTAANVTERVTVIPKTAVRVNDFTPSLVDDEE